jgi:hypothetical protein
MYDELRFYTDTHISKQVALQLKRHGVDVVRCVEVGMAEADDEAHLSYAARMDRILITADQDFLRLHAQWSIVGQAHSGIFFCQNHLQGTSGVGVIVKACLFYWEAIEIGAAGKDEIRNAVVYLG